MAREFSRTDRVAQQIHKEVASILQQEYKHREPTVGMITVSGAEVSRDLSHAKIFITFYGNDEDKIKEDLAKLQDAKSFVRGLLGRRVRMRNVPALHFVRDTSIVEGARISALVNDAIAADKAKHKDDEK
ncbi:30S ribosome-binding factor RbfA [Glaciecola sp. XM2]|jgi:ribosome-binding factor A|uniref:30S ribosome-binding factor RbfA n=1 Tax=Glaciecola sp. XM2 TaxID=1914931 RepID=UPI001BDE4CA4|nr:30S ribosome-binding factor RbfA [Glaciecola sp. XM2]MBT1449440.1 30S ribosome-binding factor RbfA [Glaciecola sp. XM2]